MNSYCVYCHTAPNGKKYIGITKNNPIKRWKNGKGYVLCTAFNRAIEKYGWNNFKHEILEMELDKETACKREVYYISLFDTTNPVNGYNMTHGGEHYEPNEEWRKRASESQKRRFINLAERQKISEQKKGRKASDSTKQRMSEAHKRYIQEHPEMRDKCRMTFKGKKRSVENCEKLRLANQTKVRCIETGVVFESVEHAAKVIGVCRSSISNCLTGRSKTSGGYHFEYWRG